MSENEYLKKLLESQVLSEEQTNELEEHRKEVEDILVKKFGTAPTIRYGGSKAKGTMIAESYDLDIICYFPSDTEKTLKEIYKDVWNTLVSYYKLESKSSAIRIRKEEPEQAEHDYHIDVVPGRYIDGDDGDAFLYITDPNKERIQTNIDTHIEFISKSGCRDVIKLIKLWKARHSIKTKTFIFEIFTAVTLKDSKNKDDLAKSFKKIMEELANNFVSIRLEDPANTNNVISDSVSDSEKKMIAEEASRSVSLLEDKSLSEIERWRNVFDDGDDSVERTIIHNPPKPWAL